MTKDDIENGNKNQFDGIERLLAEYDRLDPKSRMKITELYCRSIICSPFYSNYENFEGLSRNKISLMNKNLSYFIINPDYLPTGIDNDNKDNEAVQENLDFNLSTTTKPIVEQDIVIKHLFNFDLLLENMKNFAKVITTHKSYFDNNLKSLTKFLMCIVIIPSRLILHKIVTFNEKIINKMKYNIYKITSLLMYSLRTYCEIVNEKKYYKDIKNADLLNNFFSLANKTVDESFFNDIINTTTKRLKAMDDPSYDFLNLKKMLDIYKEFIYMINFKYDL